MQFSVFLSPQKASHIIEILKEPEKDERICKRRNELSYSGKIIVRAHSSIEDNCAVCPVYIHPSGSLVICRVRREGFCFYYTFCRGAGGKIHVTGVRSHLFIADALLMLAKTFNIKPGDIKPPIKINSISGNGRLGRLLKLSRAPTRADLFISVRFNREVFPGAFYIIKQGALDDQLSKNQIDSDGRSSQKKAGCLCLFRNGSFCASGIRHVKHLERIEDFIRQNIIGEIP